jgi:hypothetical protein
VALMNKLGAIEAVEPKIAITCSCLTQYRAREKWGCAIHYQCDRFDRERFTRTSFHRLRFQREGELNGRENDDSHDQCNRHTAGLGSEWQ